MARYESKGCVIEIALSQFGLSGYFVEALYRYVDSEKKYKVSLFTVTKQNNEVVAICPIDTQYLECEKNEVKTSITKVVKLMCDRKLIQDYLIPNSVWKETKESE